MNVWNRTVGVVGRLQKSRSRAAVLVVVVIIAGVLAQSTPAQAAYGPNVIVNGSFEDPPTPSGVASAPFGTCGATVPVTGGVDGLTVFSASVIGSSREGCWTLAASGPGTTPTFVDRTLAKGGLQSARVQSQSQNLAMLTQAVPASVGSYRLQFKATQEPGSFAPMTVVVWSVSAGVVNQTSAVKAAPAANLVDGSIPQTWTSYKVDITTPTGTDHIVVCLCSIDAQTVGVFRGRFDAVTLKRKV